jgi:hypothetical protein
MKTPTRMISSIWLWVGLAWVVTLIPLVNLYAIPVVVGIALVAFTVSLISSWRKDARRDEALRRIEERRATGRRSNSEPPPIRKAS